jgi:hypothetical protein
MKITISSIPFRSAGSCLPFLRLLSLFLCGSLLVSCAPPAPLPTPTFAIPTATGTATPTIQWFPPTKTRPQLPSQVIAATPEYHPGIGDLIFSDSFTEPDLWSTTSSPEVSALVTRNRLLLSFSGQGPFSLMSLRSQPSLDNFYAEATADISLCSQDDQYGLVFRAQPGLNFYRFVINCAGQVRLERSHNGQIYPIQDWVTSGDATFGAPARVTLGVWAVGNEMRVFLNDNFQFSVRDPLFHSGSIGFFIFAAGKTTITASFSDLLVYSVAYTAPALIPSPTPTP